MSSPVHMRTTETGPGRDAPSTTETGPGLDALRGTVAEAWLRQRGRARHEGRAGYLALRVRVPALDPLDTFLASRESSRFFWSQPAEGVDRAAAGEAWSCAIPAGSTGDRFEATARAVGDVLDRLEVLGDPAPASAGPIVHVGFAYSDRRASDPARPDAPSPWEAFPVAEAVLARHQVARVDGACFECRVIEVDPEAGEDGWQSLFGPGPAARRDAERCDAAPSADLAADGSHQVERAPEYTVRSDRPHARYEAQVADAVQEIGRGGLQKVVLARALDVDHVGEFGQRQFLEQLRAAYPACATFVCAHGDALFVSASPERLVALEGDLIRTSALAGSAARGRSPESDARLARDLLACPKNRAEHDAVRQMIVSTLERHARGVRAAPEPGLLRLSGIQHLETPIEARLAEHAGRPGEELVRLAAALHPTPAVGGLPPGAADAWIAEHEHLDRGWYAAPVGWVAANGDGELRVALRSALIRRESGETGLHSRARLYAGAGIVEGSVPHEELVETRIKLRALLAPLTEI